MRVLVHSFPNAPCSLCTHFYLMDPSPAAPTSKCAQSLVHPFPKAPVSDFTQLLLQHLGIPLAWPWLYHTAKDSPAGTKQMVKHGLTRSEINLRFASKSHNHAIILGIGVEQGLLPARSQGTAAVLGAGSQLLWCRAGAHPATPRFHQYEATRVEKEHRSVPPHTPGAAQAAAFPAPQWLFRGKEMGKSRILGSCAASSPEFLRSSGSTAPLSAGEGCLLEKGGSGGRVTPHFLPFLEAERDAGTPITGCFHSTGPRSSCSLWHTLRASVSLFLSILLPEESCCGTFMRCGVARGPQGACCLQGGGDGASPGQHQEPYQGRARRKFAGWIPAGR